MAKYITLPIYKAGYGFLIKITKIISQFPREYKYTIGDKLQNTAADVIIDIYRANSTKDKVPLLKQLLEKLQMIYLFINIAYDFQILPKKDYSVVIEMVDDIANQAQGWLKIHEKVREPV